MSNPAVNEGQKIPATHATEIGVDAEKGGAACSIGKKGWLRGPLKMAICCGAPLLLIAAISIFGFSLGEFASGALSLLALLACPVGMFLMMRIMTSRENSSHKETNMNVQKIEKKE